MKDQKLNQPIMHTITVDALIPSQEGGKETIVRRSWNLDESPFWNSYVPGGKGKNTISYPVLPYPGVRRSEFPLADKITFSFESLEFCERSRSKAFAKEIFVTVRVMGIGSSDAPDEETRVNAGHLHYFLDNKWAIHDPDDDDC